jgi:hypothetical protein
MVGQQAYGWYIWDEGLNIMEATVDVANRNTFAEVALTRLNDIEDGDGIRGQIGIIQVVSNSGTENFDPVKQAVYRKGVTRIKIYMNVLNGYARGRLMLNYWS